jgi:hypothetical protein
MQERRESGGLSLPGVGSSSGLVALPVVVSMLVLVWATRWLLFL